MRVVVQRVSGAGVTTDIKKISSIGRGLLLLVGIGKGDGEEEVRSLARKIPHLRIFEDDNGLMNRSVIDIGGEVLAVSQFTLLARWRKGRRPSFTDAAPAEEAEPLFDLFVSELRSSGVPCSTGRFGALMEVRLVNHGPVTLILDTSEDDS